MTITTDEKAPKASYSISSYFVIGLSILFLGILAFVAAAFSVLPLAAFAGVAFVLMGLLRLWGAASLARLDVELTVNADHLFWGDSLVLSTSLSNRKLLPVWVDLRLPHPEALKLEMAEAVQGESALLPFEKVAGSWNFTATRRGVHRLGPAVLTASDILDLYRKERLLPFERDIVVYPRIHELTEMELPFRDHFGIHPSKGIVEDPAWYEGTRDYSGTKPARHIHWKASARLDSLQEKIFEPTSHKKIFFIIEGEGFRRADDREGFEEALEMAASLAWRFAAEGASFAVATDRLVRGRMPSTAFGRGPEHLGIALEMMARCEFEHGQALLPLIASSGPQGAGFVVVARKQSESLKKFQSLPASRRDRIKFVFIREEEA